MVQNDSVLQEWPNYELLTLHGMLTSFRQNRHIAKQYCIDLKKLNVVFQTELLHSNGCKSTT